MSYVLLYSEFEFFKKRNIYGLSGYVKNFGLMDLERDNRISIDKLTQINDYPNNNIIPKLIIPTNKTIDYQHPIP
jgi:hypothetical protein